MWIQEKQFMLAPSIGFASQRVASFKEFPPRNAPANYSLDSVLKVMSEAAQGAGQ